MYISRYSRGEERAVRLCVYKVAISSLSGGTNARRAAAAEAKARNMNVIYISQRDARDEVWLLAALRNYV